MSSIEHGGTGEESFEDRYRRQRDAFLGDQQKRKEMEHWKLRDDNFVYPNLFRGMIPETRFKNGNLMYRKTDTWFSEYEGKGDQVIAPRAQSDYLIIGNKFSYDKRLYPQYEPDESPEGQGFAHCMVIPKRRIFNIVDPDATANNCAVIKAMKAYFVDFWDIHKFTLVESVQKTFDKENEKLYQRNFDVSLRKQLEDDFSRYFELLRKQKPEDFVYGFHAFPDNTIGHLHMHVFPKNEELREHSAKQHDWKTIPIEAVLAVEAKDAEDRAKAKRDGAKK